MLYRLGFLCAAACLCAASFGCDSDDTDDGTGGTSSSGTGGSTSSSGTGGGGGSTGGGGPTCTDPVDVPCSDDVILQLNLKVDPAPGLITNEQDGTGWISHIDATAGGFGTSNPHSFVYGKFADNGLEKVAIGDEDSLDSMDWDIAFRRYVARINSGNSGPSCVLGAVVPNPPAYEDLTIVPAGLNLGTDTYFTESCTLIDDGTGLGSPDTVLSDYWTYTACVAMTDNIFILSLADGRKVKLLVTNYYDYQLTSQDDCDNNGTANPPGSAVIRMRWAFVQ